MSLDTKSLHDMADFYAKTDGTDCGIGEKLRNIANALDALADTTALLWKIANAADSLAFRVEENSLYREDAFAIQDMVADAYVKALT